MSAPKMPNVKFSCIQIAGLLADKLTPDSNFEEQLWSIARANSQEATEYLCLLLRTQFDFQPKQDEESFFHHCFTDRRSADHQPFNVIVSASCAKDIARRALVLRDARQRLQNDPSPFPFLQLPFDIRLQVYESVFINNQNLERTYCREYLTTPGETGCQLTYKKEFQAETGIFGTDINTALLLTSQQIFNEAEPILYQTRFLEIGVHLNKGLEFLRSLSPRARRNIRAVRLALPYFYVCDGRWRNELDNNLEAWCELCDYISQNLRLRALSFNAFVEAVPANFVDAPWVKHLVKIRGLKHLMQRELDFDDLGAWLDFDDDESAPEPDPGSYKGLHTRLQALQIYLISEMCQHPTSRLLTEKEVVWGWKAYFRPDWAAKVEPET